jgi:hypothetical protein
MLCHRYKMPFIIIKSLVWEELDKDYNENFEENYEDKEWFAVRYKFDEKVPTQLVKFVRMWVDKFNKKSRSPYYAELERDYYSYKIVFKWDGFNNYSSL